ncbi:hypothetical protein BDD12DRAFT_897322 [Trichophaea hybrida]|nr:hypothetical protein BDD12DRAFT_898481 [Trichophaea hybrida]KAF8533968.1 hypothetical protein BDD12DRAFT_897322 [Trichophaea hybrida]
MSARNRPSSEKLPAKMRRRPDQRNSPLWERAKQRYLMELQERNDFDSALETASWEMILVQTKAQSPSIAQNTSLLASVQRLEPALIQMNNFATVIALALPVADTLNNVVSMLGELSLSLPKFRAYEEALPMHEGFEAALLDVYVEMICFCARIITFFRCNPHQLMLRAAWPSLDNDFKMTIKRLQSLSQVVEQEAEAARMILQAERNTEILSLMQSLKVDETNKSEGLRCFHVPFALNDRFVKRNDAVEHIGKILDPAADASESFKSLAIYGTGGVGKTQIALQYAHQSRRKFDCVLWISADNNIKMTQDFLAVAQRLGLVPNDGNMNDPVGAITKTKRWLADTTCRWLLIFDNADSLEVLKYGWPGGCSGSVLVTTRDFTAGFSLAAHGMQISPFDDDAGASVFLSMIGQEANDERSGQIARRSPENWAKIHKKKAGISDYNHTLGTVWEMALSSLNGDAATLQQLLAFLDPDQIHEQILVSAVEKICKDADEHPLAFIADEMDFIDAKEVLLRAALIERSPETELLSVHRLVQIAVIDLLSTAEREKSFNYVIDILSEAFPSSWTNDTAGYVFEAWETCEKCIHHVYALAARARSFKLQPKGKEKFAELLSRAAWYLYEAEHYAEGKVLLNVVLDSLHDKTTLEYARAVNLYGLLCIDTNQATAAVEHIQQGLWIREELLGHEHPRVAISLSNLGMCYTEIGPPKLDEAMESLEKSLAIRLKSDPGMVGNTYSNMSSLYLRMRQPDQAEAILAKCPSLKDMNDVSFCGRIIHAAQGRVQEALRLGTKALEFRRKHWGNGFKTCAALCNVATLLHQEGNPAIAYKLLEECITIGKSLSEAEGFVALAHFEESSRVYKGLKFVHVHTSGLEHLQEAIRAKKQLFSQEMYKHLQDFGDEDERSYEQLVAWMLLVISELYMKV